ncbi:MAG: hypothetical protein GXZ18_00760 [Synergistaceae bacterium]|nr:hypothetical protein [Synergistaceae bacterium]
MEINKLLDKLDKAETDEEIRNIGEEILEHDSNNPYGKLAIWQTMEYEDCMENLDILSEALDTIRAVVEAKTEPVAIDEDRDAEVYCTIMMNLGFCLLAKDESDDALVIAREFVNFDSEGFFPSRTLIYCCMLDLNMYREILETVESDQLESVVGEHARAIALIETDADSGEIRDAVNYAISLDPDVPFFILNIWDFPENEEDIEETMEDSMDSATYLTAAWTATDERLAAISGPTFLFGYLTERLTDEKEIKALKEGYEGVGVLDEVEEAKARISAMEEDVKDPLEVDAFALGETANILESLFSE